MSYTYFYSQDKQFLKDICKERNRTIYAKLLVLDFEENPIQECSGTFTQGNINLNGSSAVRRTLSSTMQVKSASFDLENIENEVSIDKKIEVFVGLENNLKLQYPEYAAEDIIWFPQGIFVISSANASHTTTTCSINLQGKDKMCTLDGSAGGTLTETVVLNTREIQNEDGTYTIEDVEIREIIFNLVHHYGKVPANKIFIEMPETGTQLMKYMGEDPIYFNKDYTGYLTTKEYDKEETNKGEYPNKINYNQDVGYRMTPLTYPGELCAAAGETVTSILDKISKLLGNFEFFFDINGNFYFQPIKNYLNTASPLDKLEVEHYIQSYSTKSADYDFSTLDGVIQISQNPRYDNIKNDFVVWGNLSGNDAIPIEYRVRIDQKPQDYYNNMYVYEKLNEEGVLISIEFETEEQQETSVLKCIGKPCSNNWREELYRRNLQSFQNSGLYYDDCGMELLAKWRWNFDPMNEDWPDGWNPDIKDNPKNIKYWLDFIDTYTFIGKHSVQRIGKRAKVQTDQNVQYLYNNTIPNVLFVNSLEEYNQYKDLTAYKIFYVAEDDPNFTVSASGVSAFDKIREMLYQNTTYNTSLNITTIPHYYIEPNKIIYVEDKKLGIAKNFLANTITIPLAYSGIMSISASEILERI